MGELCPAISAEALQPPSKARVVLAYKSKPAMAWAHRPTQWPS
jgi:hypothetical protein